MNENVLNESFLRFEKLGFFGKSKQVLTENWDEEQIQHLKNLIKSGQ